jgi:hypothetical protein
MIVGLEKNLHAALEACRAAKKQGNQVSNCCSHSKMSFSD